MSNNIDLNTLRAMSNIVASEDGKVYLTYQKDLFKTMAGNIALVKDEVQLRWTQGQLKQIGENIKGFETAEETIHALKLRNK